MEIAYNKKVDNKFKDVNLHSLFIQNGDLYMKVECCSERFVYNALKVGDGADYTYFCDDDVIAPVSKISVEH